MNSTNTLSVSDLRKNTASVIASIVKTQKPKVIMQRSKPKVVLVDVDYFDSLESAFFDITDSREAKKAKSEKKDLLDKYIEKRWATKSV